MPNGSVGINAYALDNYQIDFSRGVKISLGGKPYFLSERYNVVPLQPLRSCYLEGAYYKDDPFSLSLDGQVVFPIDYPEKLEVGEIVMLNMTLDGLGEAVMFEKLFSGDMNKSANQPKHKAKTRKSRNAGF